MKQASENRFYPSDFGQSVIFKISVVYKASKDFRNIIGVIGFRYLQIFYLLLIYLIQL